MKKNVLCSISILILLMSCQLGQVQDGPLTLDPSFTYSPILPVAGRPVQFTDTSSGGSNSRLWDFGDGTTITTINPTHSYAVAGSYTATLTIKSGFISKSMSQSITVLAISPGTIDAASPSWIDVKTAIDAADTGDTVFVPAGSAMWSQGISITKGITLKGAGVGNTIITSNIGSNSSGIFIYTPSDFSANNSFRISGFTLNLNNSSHGIILNHSQSYSLTIQTKIRIDHNTFTGATSTVYQGVKNYGMRGVVDNNTFDNLPYPIRSDWSGTQKSWWDNWEAVVFGKADNNMYFEDNIFTGIQIVSDCQNANRYVFRYNTITCAFDNWPLFDMHGNQGGGFYAGFGGEIYGNQITNDADTDLCDHRGGKMLIFMNNKTTSTPGDGGWWQQVRDEWADSIDPTTNPSPQHPNDSYYWLNRENLTGAFAGVAILSQRDNPPLANTPTENRDFFVGKNNFNGTMGMGYGPLASRPTTCAVGVAYWATDQSVTNLAGMVGKNPTTPIFGTLYKCMAPNVWTAYYTPYTYPHPLRTLLSD